MQEPEAQCSCGSSENNKSEVNEKKIDSHNPTQLENNCISKYSMIPVKATKTEELICSCKLKESPTDINLQNDQWKAEGENIGYKNNKDDNTKHAAEIKIISEVPDTEQPVLEDNKKPEHIEISKICENKNKLNSEKDGRTEESSKQGSETITFEELDSCTVEGCDTVIPPGVVPKISPINQRSRVVIKIRLNDLLKDKPYIQNITPHRETIETEISKIKVLQSLEESNTEIQVQEHESLIVCEDKATNIKNTESKKGKYYYTKEEATLLDSIKKLFKTKQKKKKTIICPQPAEKIPTTECRIKVEAWEKHDTNTCSGDEKYTYIGELLFPICSKEIFYHPPGVPIRKSMKSYTLNDPNNFRKTEVVHRIYAYREKVIPYELFENDENKIENCVNVVENRSEQQTHTICH